MSELISQADRLKEWLIDRALPFWAQRAIDPYGGFYEDLNLVGGPRIDNIRRLRVQARQIYTYALAHKLGWYDGREIANNTFSFMLKYGYQKGGMLGFIHLLDPDYSVRNPTRDLYDHAFYLLACGLARDGVGNEKAKRIGYEIFDFISTELKSSSGGWNEEPGASLPRRQNPHMHLFEACMCWHLFDPQGPWASMSQEIFTLFETHFFDPKHHIIREFFDNDWAVYRGELGRTVEPGHAAEWIWLLWMYEKQTNKNYSDYCDKLYNRLLKSGSVFLNDEEDITGEIRRSTKRLWGQAEYIKAHLAQAERGRAGAADLAALTLEAFFTTYLQADGGWIDQIDNHNQPCSQTMPTSTFYHIITMISEACRVSQMV